MKNIKKFLLIFCFVLSLFLFSKNIASASGNSYYLSTTGNNTNTGTGTNAAWATLDYVCPKLQAGDTLYVMEGIYVGQKCEFKNSGTEANPITVTAYGNMPTFRGIDGEAAMTWDPAQKRSNIQDSGYGIYVRRDYEYININKLKIEYYHIGITINGSHVNITNCDIGKTSGEVLLVADNFRGVHDVFVTGNKLHDTGTHPVAAEDYDYETEGRPYYFGPLMVHVFGRHAADKSYNIHIDNNEIYGASYHGTLQFSAQANGENPPVNGVEDNGLENVYAENNYIHDTGGNCGDRDSGYTACGPAGIVTMHGTVVKLYVRNNTLINNPYGIIVACSDSVIEGNQVVNTSPGNAINILASTVSIGKNTIVRNNTVTKTDASISDASSRVLKISAAENFTIIGNDALINLVTDNTNIITFKNNPRQEYYVKTQNYAIANVEYEAGKIFVALIGSPWTNPGVFEPVKYYSSGSKAYVRSQSAGANTLNIATYPAYAVPTSVYLTITVNTVNKDTDIWDFTVTSSVPENPTTFTLETLHPNTVYSVKRDIMEIATANTDGTGKLFYSYQVEGNEFDTSHNFKFVSTGVAVPSTHTLTVTNGTGSGSYTQNQSVTIIANPPAIGKEFDKWAGDITSVSDINSSTTTLTMPASAASLTATYKDTTSVSTPTFSPAAGTYTSTQIVNITSATSVSSIYYTVDGSTPTISSSLYSSPITVSATQTIKAIAIKSGLSNSTIGSAAYTINPVSIVSTPTFSPAAGTFSSAQTVAISSATSGATIYYNTNGNSPTVSSTQYTTPITISSTTTVKAIAMKAGLTNSSIASATYTITPTTTGTAGGGGTTAITPTITKVEITKTEGNLLTLSLNVQNATSMMLSESSSFLGSVWETYYPTKTYTKQPTQTKLYLKFKSSTDTISSTIELNIPTNTTTTTTPDTPNPYPSGTLLKLPDSFKVYVIIGGNKKWIPTPEVFEQLGYKWTEIKILTPTELNTIPDYEDNLIRQLGDYKVYLVVNGVKRHIPNPIIFLDYGFKWDEVKDVPQSTIDKYKPTYLIKQSGSNGIYYVNPQEIRKLIPSTEIFNSYNDKTEDIQIISKTEMDFYPLSNLIKLNGSNDIYLIEGNIKKHIPSVQVFNKYKLNWSLVTSVNQTEFNFYQDRGELK